MPIPPQVWDMLLGLLRPVLMGLGLLVLVPLLIVVLVSWKRGRLPFTSDRRMSDPAMQQLVTLVKENTAAFQALKSQGEDHKNISVTLCAMMNEVRTALAMMNRGNEENGRQHRRAL